MLLGLNSRGTMGRMEFLSYGFNFSGDEHFFMIIYIFTAFFAEYMNEGQDIWNLD